MTDRTVRVVLEGVVTGFRNNIRAAGQTVRTEGARMARVAEQNRASFTALGLAMGAAGAAITLGLRRAGREAIAFDSTLTKSVTLIGVARDEMDEMGQAALRMGHTGQGPIELAEALFFVQSAGMRGQEALDVVEASAKAASIGLGETATIADLVTSAVNAYGVENLNAAQATDVLIGTVREGKAEAPQLAGALGRVLPIASEMGVKFHEVGAAVAAMTRTGSDAATSTTQLRAILVSLLNPADKAEAAMSDLGLSSSQLRRVIREDGLWQAMMMLREAVGDNEAALGSLFPNVRALAGFLDLTGANAAENAEVFASMADTVGLLDEGFSEWSTTMEASIARFQATSQSARIALMEGLERPLTAVLDAGTALADWFIGLPSWMRGAIAITAGVTGGLLMLGGAALLVSTRVMQLRAAMVVAGTQMFSFRTAAMRTGMFLAGPWGAALAGAALALGVFAKQAADARERTRQLRDTLDQANGAITQQTRAWVANELATRDTIAARGTTIEQARRLGITEQDLANAILGQEDALQRVQAVLDPHLTAWGLTSSLWDRGNRDAIAVNTALQEMREALGSATDEVLNIDHAIRELNPELAQLADRFELTGEDAVEAASDMIQAWAEAGDEFGGLMSAYAAALSDAEAAERAKAESAAVAAGKGKGAWEDFASDVEVSIDKYIEQLERIVADQAAWSENLIRLSGRVPDAMLDQLARLGPEGAPLVAMLADAGNKELARVAQLWPHTTEQGMAATMDVIAHAGPQLRAIAEQHGMDVAIAIADQMKANGGSIEDAAESLGFRFINFIGPVLEGVPPVKILLDERSLRQAENSFNFLARTRTVDFRLTTSGEVVLPSGIRAHASGGLIGGEGGPREDRNLILASKGEYMMQASAVDRYGLGFMEAVNSMRLPAFAGGGPVSSVRVPAMASGGQVVARGGDGAGAAQPVSVTVLLDGRAIEPRMVRVLDEHDRVLTGSLDQGAGGAW